MIPISKAINKYCIKFFVSSYYQIFFFSLKNGLLIYHYFIFSASNKAEEQTKLVDEQRQLLEERQKFESEQRKKEIDEQKLVLGKKGVRPKLSFSLTSR